MNCAEQELLRRNQLNSKLTAKNNIQYWLREWLLKAIIFYLFLRETTQMSSSWNRLPEAGQIWNSKLLDNLPQVSMTYWVEPFQTGILWGIVFFHNWSHWEFVSSSQEQCVGRSGAFKTHSKLTKLVHSLGKSMLLLHQRALEEDDHLVVLEKKRN